ncbi:DnaD domain protein [Candidatus Phytoplasma sacchari]|nr:DnaD domain protein [Candidatus Phytoplasma sacchari]
MKMLKNLYKKGYLNIEKILIKEFINLNLEINELAVLLLLFNDDQDHFSSLNLAEKTNFSKNEIEEILENLIKKNFFNIVQEQKNEKFIEKLNFDNTFIKLEKILNKKKIEQKETKNYNKEIKETIENLEKIKGRILTGFELEIVKNWYLSKGYSHKDIIDSIKKSSLYNKKSLNYIDYILNKKKDLLYPKDLQTDEILYKIFKKIK